MKKRIGVIILAMITAFTMCFCMTGCGGGGEESSSEAEAPAAAEPQVTCENGIFVGQVEEETGVMSFKGIPYAKSPVVELRWKAPEPVDASEETLEAKKFGQT